MVIDVKKLKFSGKETCSFHFEYEADDSAITLRRIFGSRFCYGYAYAWR